MNIDIDMYFLENIDIDIVIDKEILKNIDIDEISYRLEQRLKLSNIANIGSQLHKAGKSETINDPPTH